MLARFIHTADWQLGKPFAGIDDDQKRSVVRQERLSVIERIAAKARETNADFVLVAGDVFDSSTASRAVVSEACAAIGRIGLPVLVIPGNHDHGGPGSVWEQEYFLREKRELAPNLRVLLTDEPVELDTAIIFPCPLRRRAEVRDTTAWIRSLDFSTFGVKPRIVLAHGSSQSFTATGDDEESGASNEIELQRLPIDELDYIALGDWHGCKNVGAMAWYSGAPELDRFPKGESNEPGFTLAVTAQRGAPPEVNRIRTARLGWHELEHQFTDDTSLAALEERIGQMVTAGAGQDLLRIRLNGSLGIEQFKELEQKLNTWRARFLRLDVFDQTQVAPTQAELESLAQRGSDPLISSVASKLAATIAAGGDEAVIARIALRELYALAST